MNTKLALAFMSFGMIAVAALAQEAGDIVLPPARTTGGKPLMEVLMNRESSREFSPAALPEQILSDVLWAAAGINRPDSGKRTAPSARNLQEVEVYAVLEGGAYLYDAQKHVLHPVVPGDLRRLTGVQDFVALAPLNLVYVADTTKMSGASSEDQALYNGADTGFMCENVYLYCASEGLAVVVRGSIDRAPLAEALKLPATKKIVLAQTVGYPVTTKQ